MTTLAPTAQELIAAMHQAVTDTPSLKSRFNACVEFHLEDVQERVDISKMARTSDASPDLIVTTSLDVFHQLLNKKLTPQQAFMQGKLKIKGKMGLAMKLNLVLNATRKVLQKSGTFRSKL